MNIFFMIIIFAIAPFILTYLLLKWYIKFAYKRGIVAEDAHKVGRPKVANMGGIVFIVPVTLFFLLASLFYSEHAGISVLNEVLATVISFVIGFIVGLLDDLKDLKLKKVPLLPLAAFPFLVLQAYYPRPMVPFIGQIRISIIYPLLIIVAFTIVSNGSNMIDVHNGTLATSVIAVLVPLEIWSVLLNDWVAFTYISIVLGITLGFFVHNHYPAKVFAGNVGSHSLGILLAAVIILSRLEFIAIIAWLPTVLTGFYLISSIKGLKSRNDISKKWGKTVIIKDGVLYPSTSKNAPISLTRLILLEKGPLTEREVIREYYKLYAFTAFLAFITGFITYL